MDAVSCEASTVSWTPMAYSFPRGFLTFSLEVLTRGHHQHDDYRLLYLDPGVSSTGGG